MNNNLEEEDLYCLENYDYDYLYDELFEQNSEEELKNNNVNNINNVNNNVNNNINNNNITPPFDYNNFTHPGDNHVLYSQEENFDAFDYFSLYSQLFFEDKLGCVRLEWSKRMTSCAGIFSVRNNEPVIRLSEPLLKFRSVNEIKETLLHEMIHAWAFIEDSDQSDDRTGHGMHFKMKMYEVNKNTGLNITVYHSFHEEVDYYKKHVWRCEGRCRNQSPYYGYVKRAMNRAPGSYDRWWKDHQINCGGTFIKIEGDEKNTNTAEENKKGNNKNNSTLDKFVKKGKKNTK